MARSFLAISEQSSQTNPPSVRGDATNTRCDAVVTFARKLANKLESFGLEAYF
jgi:hypothetical protein